MVSKAHSFKTRPWLHEVSVADPDVQGGVPTFKGTRIPVYQITGLLKRGVPERELREDYPHLTAEMIDAAQIYVRVLPHRRWSRKPNWRKTKPL